jgi:type VI protein secretion system component VasF
VSDRLTDRFAPFLMLLAGVAAAPPRDEDDLQRLRERLLEALHPDPADEQDPAAARRIRLARPLLVYGADGIVIGAGGALGRHWRRLEQELFRTSRGGDDFFDRLEHDPEYAEPALQELALALLVLGFRGRLAADPEGLADLRTRIAARLEAGDSSDRRLSPQAYDAIVATSTPDLPVVGWIRLVALSLGGILIIAVLGNAISACTIKDLEKQVEKALTNESP